MTPPAAHSAKQKAKPSANTPQKKAKLKFPSVSTRPTKDNSAPYDSQGIPFTFPSGNCVMNLATYFGPQPIASIQNHGEISFHAMGDSGVGHTEQEQVANAMAADIDESNHPLGPSFMVHLGDVIYGPNKQANYYDRFYRMYDHYDRLIFAVPGNHDGEVYPTTDPKTLAAFITNFCSPAGQQPPLAKQNQMLMPNQPGPYWHLQAPFVDIVGLYSNSAENTGIISNRKIGTQQKTWLQQRLTAIAAARASGIRNALVIALHHPPYASGLRETGYGHPGSPEMLEDIDACCIAAGILPDAVIAGHTHSYQHYVRTQPLNHTQCTIPYLIIGTGGIGLQKLPAPTGVKSADGLVKYVSAFEDYGYITVTASSATLTLAFTAVVATHRELREQITVNLATHQIA